MNIYTGKCISRFEQIIPIIPYDKNQRQFLIDRIVNTETINKQDSKANLSSYWLPYGMTFQCVHNNDQWVMITSSLARMNEATFGGTESLQCVFEKMLKLYGIGLEYLDTNVVYTFHIAMKDFALIPIVED